MLRRRPQVQRSAARRRLRRTLSTCYRPGRLERLEDRRLLAVTAPALGSSNAVVFYGDAAADYIAFSVNDAGQLQHNRGGSFDFVSNVDLDPVTPGEQSRLVSEITSFRYEDAGENDQLSFTGSNAFVLGSTDLLAQAGKITVYPNVAIESTDGSIQFVAEQNILLGDGTRLTTVDGGISLMANEDGEATGDFAGLEAYRTTIQTTGTGAIELRANGGDDSTNSAHPGIWFGPGSWIESSSDLPTAGAITMLGGAGEGSSSNVGVALNGSDIVVRSKYGDIEIVGHGGYRPDGAASLNHGVSLAVDAIESTGTGDQAATITINGTGGAGRNSNYGVSLAGASMDITSVDGDIHISGQGGGDGLGYSNSGIYSSGLGSIASTGTTEHAATITISGNGGLGTRSDFGIALNGTDTQLTSGYGDISVVGHGGTGGGYSNFGIDIGFAISSTGTGENAAAISIDGFGGADSSGGGANVSGSIHSVDGEIAIVGRGSGDGTRSSNYGVRINNVETITATGAAGITVDGIGGEGISNNYGVQITGAATDLTTTDGPIRIVGRGGNGSSSGNMGVHITGIEGFESKGRSDGENASSGTITIDGTGGNGAGSNRGVYWQTASAGITSVDGAIRIIGQGGESTYDQNNGVYLYNVAGIHSTGSGEFAATISIIGTGGDGRTANDGVSITGSVIDGVKQSRITSKDGDILIQGTGGAGDLEYSSSEVRGVALGEIELVSTGTTADAATIRIDGTSGISRRNSYGTLLERSTIRATAGTIDIVGQQHPESVSGGGISGTNVVLESDGEGELAANIRAHSEDYVYLYGTIATVDGDVEIVGGSETYTSISGALTSTGWGSLTVQGDSVNVSGSTTTEFGDIHLLGRTVYSNSDIESLGAGAEAGRILIGDASTESIRLNGDLTSVDGDIHIVNHISDASTGPGYVWIYGDIRSTGQDKQHAATITVDGTGTENQSGVVFRRYGQIITSVAGNIAISGTAGDGSNGSLFGVQFDRIGALSSTGTGANAAQITVSGTAGAGSSNNIGVYFYGDGNSLISSHSGAVSITGVGGAGSSSNNVGVRLQSGAIESTGTDVQAATITIDGTGGEGSYNNHGVEINLPITSEAGAIAITGSGGASSNGVYLPYYGSLISTGQGTTAATISVDGTAGSGQSGSGVHVRQGTLASVDGDISLTGRGNALQTTGMLIEYASITSSGTGEHAATIDLLGMGTAGLRQNDGLEINGSTTSITSVDGDITIEGRAGDSSSSRGLTLGAFSTIASTGTQPGAATVTLIGTAQGQAYQGLFFDYGTSSPSYPRSITSVMGDIYVSGHTDSGTALATSTGRWQITSTGTGQQAAKIHIDGTSETGSGLSWFEPNSQISTVDGDLFISGTGSRGTNLSVPISSTGAGHFAGNLSISGTSTTSNGLYLGDSVTTVDGDILLQGSATSDAAGSSAHGMRIFDAVSSTGTGTTAGRITLTGTTAGVDAIGVYVYDGLVTSVDGDIHISGTAEAEAGSGVHIVQQVTSTGTDKNTAANITIVGSGGASDGIGVLITSGNSSQPNISTVAGDLQITGSGGAGVDSRGIYLANGYVLSSGDTAGHHGNLSLHTDSIELHSGGLQSGGTLTIQPLLDGTSIGLGGGEGDLNLDDAELALLVDGFAAITIGSDTAGRVEIDTATFTDDITIQGTQIHDHAGTDVTAGSNTVTLKGTVAPGRSPGILDVAGEFQLDDNTVLELEFDGPLAGDSADSHDQIIITGSVAIGSDVDLQLTTTNGFAPTVGQQYLLLDNDGDDSIYGTFAGLPEGAIISDFLNAAVDARISYLGTDETTGNDIVLTIIQGNRAPVADAGGAYRIDEGGSLTLDGSASSDPDGDPLSFAWDLNGDGDFSDASGATPTLSAAELTTWDIQNEGVFQVRLQVHDGRADSLVAAATVTVNNVAPTLTAAGAGGDAALDYAADGVFSRLAIPFNDPGLLDAHRLEIDWDGDDQVDQTLSISPVGSRTFDLQHTFTAAGTFEVTVTLKDDADDQVSDSFVVTVLRNDPPVANAGGPYTVDEGGPVELDAGRSFDREQDDATLDMQWDLDGDGVFGETSVDATRGDEIGFRPTFSAAGVSNPHSFTVQLRATDELGEWDLDEATITVQNAVPVLQFDSEITVEESASFSLPGEFIDAGDDHWMATVDYADGLGEQPLSLEGKQFELSHVYDAAGFYTVRVRIDDGDGGVRSKDLTVIVQPPSLPDLTLISSDVGFSPLNPASGQTVVFVADVTNDGSAAALNVPLRFQVYDADADSFVELGRSLIPEIDADSKLQVSFTWDGGEGQPALTSEDAFLLVRVEVDPDMLFEESDETNNLASQVLQIGSPDFGSAAIVGIFSPRTTCQSQYVSVGGQAFYDFDTVPGEQDFPVQSGNLTVRLIDPDSGSVLAVAAGSRSSLTGSFTQRIRSPQQDGVYTVQMELSDGTLTSVFETTLEVRGECATPPPSNRVPAGPGYVFSTSIGFDQPTLPPDNPQLGDTITINGSLYYELEQPLSNVPVTFNDIFPVAGQLRTFKIGGSNASFPDGGQAGPVDVLLDWTPTAEGYHLIQLVAEPDFDFPAHTHATQLILVGTLDTSALTVAYDPPTIETPPAAPALFRTMGGVDLADKSEAKAAIGVAVPRVPAPAPGDTLLYKIRYENTGSTTITNATLIDYFDAALVGTPSDISDLGTTADNYVSWNLGDLPAGASGTVTYRVTMKAAAELPPGTTRVANTAVLNADQAAAAGTTELELSNDAPVISNLSIDPQLDAEGQVSLTGSFSDASVVDTHSVQIQWGDGETDTIVFSDGERSFTLDHRYDLSAHPDSEAFFVDVSVVDASENQAHRSVTTLVPQPQTDPPPEDQTNPASVVRDATFDSLTGNYDLVVEYTDPAGAENEIVSGVTSVEIFYRVNPQSPGAVTQSLGLAELPPASYDGTTTFSMTLDAQPGDIIELWSVARDAADNLESEVTPRTDFSFAVADTVGPATQVDAAQFDGSALIQLNVSGSDVGGGHVQTMDVYVDMDPGTPDSQIIQIGSINGGAPAVQGSLSFAVPQDGVTHSYRFFSIGTDHLGNREGGSGELDGDPGNDGDVVLNNIRLEVPTSAEIIDFDVNGGLENRSSVRSADLLFNDGNFIDGLLDSLIDIDQDNDRIRLQRLDLAGEPLAADPFVPLTAVRDGLNLRLDFGPGGLQQNGVYALRIDMDGDPSNGFETLRTFHRLEGDINGDGAVDTADLNKVRAVYRNPALHEDADVDGDGDVDSSDMRFYSMFFRRPGDSQLGIERDDLDD